MGDHNKMVEMVEILDGRLGKRSVERVRYVIKNLLHLVIVKYGVISLVTILSLLMKYLVIFHADPCNKSYIYTRLWTKNIFLFFSDRLTLSNIRGGNSSRIYKVALPLCTPEMLSTLSINKGFSYIMHTLHYLSEG